MCNSYLSCVHLEVRGNIDDPARTEDVPMEVSPRPLALEDSLEVIQALDKGACECLVSAHGVHDVEDGGCVVLFHVSIVSGLGGGCKEKTLFLDLATYVLA